jgi:uncharacterized protein
VWAHRVPAQFRDRLPKLITLPTGTDALQYEDGRIAWGGTGHFGGQQLDEYDPRIVHFDRAAGAGPPQQRVEEQDQDGVDAELIFGGASYPPRFKDPNAAAAVTRAYNEYLAEEYCAVAPDRLLGAGYLLHRGVDQDIADMEHCAKLGLTTVLLEKYPSGLGYPTPDDDRFWAAALDLDMPITIHTSLAGMSTGRQVSRDVLTFPSKGEGYEKPPIDVFDRLAVWGSRHCGTTELTEMIMTGFFDRFPKLKIYWAENQISWIPGYLEQRDTAWEKNMHWVPRLYDVPPLKRKPSEYAKDHAYWGFFDDPFGVQACRHYIGVDHILWGSDFPHEVTNWPNDHEVLDKQFAGVPEAEKRKMLSENAVKFFHLDR